MKYFVKKSVLLLLVVLAFCACDNSNDNGDVIPPNPQSSKTVVNYTGKVEFVVEAPKIREDIEQDLKANPPFGGSKKYQFIIKKHSTLAPLFMLYAVNPEDDKSADGYILRNAGEVEYKDNYRLFPAASGSGWYKENIVPVDTKDGKPVATYDVFISKIFLLLRLVARCISAKTLRRNIARSSLMKTFMPWFAVWFFLMSVGVII